MQLHANAAVSLIKRRQMVCRVLEQGWTIAEAARAAEIRSKACGKWVSRYRADRACGLLDRGSAPKSVANRTCERRVAAIAALRRLRFTGPEIAEGLAMPLSTVSGILTRIGMGRLGRLGLEPVERYERARPGELVPIDVKKLARITLPGHRVTGNRRQKTPRTTYTPDGRRIGDAGWEYVHVAIDDCTRLAYAEALPDERASTAIASRCRVPPPPRHPRRAPDHRQRRPRSLHDPRARLPRPGHPAPAHPPPSPPDQRQSRTLHPHHARRLGLRRALPQQHRTHRSP